MDKVDKLCKIAPMQRISATQAKQRFGDMVRLAASEPVAVERHEVVQAVVMAPELFAKLSAADCELAERRLARSNQEIVELNRLIKHHRVAFALVALPKSKRDRLLAHAKGNVQRWREERICGNEYIERWTRILNMPAREMAVAITSDLDGWGRALRQNSPWNGVPLE